MRSRERALFFFFSFNSIPLSLGEAGGRCVLVFGIYYCVAFFFFSFKKTLETINDQS